MTLEEAKAAVVDRMQPFHYTGHALVDKVLECFADQGYLLCNKTLTMDQRNKMSDAFHNNFQSMQAVHDVMLKGVR